VFSPVLIGKNKFELETDDFFRILGLFKEFCILKYNWLLKIEGFDLC